MERSAYILSGLLVVTTLTAAYLHQTDDSSDDKDAVVVLDVGSDEVTSFSYSSDAFQFELVQAKDKVGPFWNAKSRRSIPQAILKTPNHKFGQIDRDTTLVTEDQHMQTRTKRFVVGLTGRSFLENMLPLRAKTAILDTDGREAEFGFDEIVGNFTIQTNAMKKTYYIGNEGYGSRVRYVKDDAGKIYAMEDRLIALLFSADTSFEGKVVFARESDDLISFAIKNQNAPISLRQVRRGDKSFWTINGGSESVRIKSWVESQLLTMNGAGFVPDELRPENLETVLEFEMELRGVNKKIAGKFLRKNSAIRPVYFLETDLTRQLVKMKSAQVVDLIASLSSLKSD